MVFAFSPLSLLFLNDGQDAEALQLEATLNRLTRDQALKPLLVVAIHAGDRMQEYGTAKQADYAGRGAKAAQYTRFVMEELLPFVEKHYHLASAPSCRAFAGFSLGGLSALDIVWNQNQHFHNVGVFSGSLWWRSEKFNPKHPDAHRIIHETLRQSQQKPGLRFWLQAGTADETADRNHNGIIDAIDDTLDLIKVLKVLGYQEAAILNM